MSILRLEGIHREVGTFVILDRIDAAIAMGDRIGLVGPNGAGKTTLLRIAAAIDEPDAGKVVRKRDLSIGMLAQEAHLDAAFMAAPDLRAAVRHGARHLEEMAAELEAMEHAHRSTEPAYEALQHRFEALGGYTLDQRVEEVLSGLGFSDADKVRAPSSLSGGEQTRATLARLVIAAPDLLFLDEPTNHLDLGALEWLEEHLRRRAGSLLVASHDRAFLDATVTRIWELRDRRLTTFRGDYSAYRRQREERDAFAAKAAETHEQQIQRERELVQTYRSHRKITKMHEHEARLERLLEQRQDGPKTQRKLRLPGTGLVGAAPVRSGEIVLRLEELAVGYVSPVARTVARVPFLAARRGERIGIVGPNGAGKTTLLRTVAGELPPLDGTIEFGHRVQLGYLAQLRAAGLPGATVIDALLETVPVTPGEARGYLARFLFRGDDVLKEVRLLSGGERSRLELALLGVMPSNLYLLDEPTNHLDVVAREAIEAFLIETPATMLVVSHDRRFLETVVEKLWVVDDGLVAPFDGGYRAWRAAIADGWTVAGAIEREAQRLRSGAIGGHARSGIGSPRRLVRRAGRGHPGHEWHREHGGPGARAVGRRRRGGAPRQAGQALQGRLPPPARGGRRRADAPRAAQEPPRARALEAGRPVQLHRAAPRVERARRRRDGACRGRGRLAGPRGARAVTVRIGITGPIGCGKSTVAGWLGELGATIIDADQVAREVTEPGSPALERIAATFGPEVLRGDGSLDRAALGRRVFGDDRAALAALEAIVHPAVRPVIADRMAEAEQSGAQAVVVEAIKLVEGGLAALCDEVWLVTCTPDEQLARLRARLVAAGGDPADAASRIRAQGNIVARLRPAATRVVDTSGSVDEARRRVRAAWSDLLRGVDPSSEAPSA